jgi:hypothetical protein
VTEPQFDAPPESVEIVEATAPESNGNGGRRGRGRPRTRETIDRDQAVLNALSAGPKTREALAEELSQPPSLVYLALWRLSHQDPPKVVKTSEGVARHAWQLAN